MFKVIEPTRKQHVHVSLVSVSLQIAPECNRTHPEQIAELESKPVLIDNHIKGER